MNRIVLQLTMSNLIKRGVNIIKKMVSFNDGNGGGVSKADNSDDRGDDSDYSGEGGDVSEEGGKEGGEHNNETDDEIITEMEENYLNVAVDGAKTPDEYKVEKLNTSETNTVAKTPDECKDGKLNASETVTVAKTPDECKVEKLNASETNTVAKTPDECKDEELNASETVTVAKTPDECKDEKLNASETVTVEKQSYCDPCKYDESLEIATCFCITCTEYLCHDCCRDHKKNKFTRGHNMLEDRNMPNDLTPFRAIRDFMKCQTHPENEVEYECVDHKRLICVSCITESHRKCDEIVDIGTSDNNYLTDAADFALVTKLRDKLKVCTQRNRETAEKIDSQRVEIKQECDALKEKWKQHIEKLGSLLQTEAEAWAKREVQASQESSNEYLKMQKDLDKHEEIMSVLTIHGSKKEVAVVSKLLAEKMNILKSKILPIENERPKQLLLRKTEPYTALTSLGSVSLKFGDAPKETSFKEAENICNSEGGKSNVSESANANTSEMMMRNVDSGKMYVVKTTTDSKTCSIVAIKKVLDGQIVVADEGNIKLKLLSKELDPVAELKLPGVPSDMCCLGNVVFLCFPELKKIYWYNVSPSLIHEPSNFGTKMPPVSLSMFDEKRLIILFKTKDTSDNSKSEDMLIEVRDGSCVKATLELPEDEEFNTIKECKWVMRCDDSSIILAENEKISCYIVDEFDQWLLCKEIPWVCNSKKKKKLIKPRGMCQDPDKKDVVYVCGEESNNVHQVLIRDFEYRQSRVLVKGVKKPLCSYVDKDRLVVGCHQDDFLHVYTFI